MRRYSIKLTDTQINNIYMITDNKDKQKKIMSVLAYMMKYTEVSTMKLTKSINKLYTMYSIKDWKYHNKITRSYFYELANLVLENDYFFGIREDEPVKTFADIQESATSLDNANVNEEKEETNNIIINNQTNTYTLYTSKDVATVDLVDEVLRDLKIKSKVIKTMVTAKLQNVVLDSKGAIAYIIKVITEKMEQYNAMKVKYARKVAESEYSKDKSTFKYSNKSAIGATSFNNFETRKYDYENLEKKLLGWA